MSATTDPLATEDGDEEVDAAPAVFDDCHGVNCPSADTEPLAADEKEEDDDDVGSLRADGMPKVVTDPLAAGDADDAPEVEEEEEDDEGIGILANAVLAAKGTTDGSKTRLATAARSSSSTSFFFSWGTSIAATLLTPA
jgi:hypothetical protein